MKKLLTMTMVILLLVSSLSACVQTPVVPDVSEPTPPQVTDPSAPEMDPSENEDQLPLAELDAVLFLPNDMADGFIEKTVAIEATPENLIAALVDNGALPTGLEILKFEHTIDDTPVASGDDAVSPAVGDSITMDCSEELQTALASTGTAGEWLMVGSLTKTVLNFYDADFLILTVDGEMVSTGHTIYDFPLTMKMYE